MRISFIYNPIAGGKSKERILSAIPSVLGKGDFEWEIFRTNSQGEGTRMAAEADADVVVAIGGDGTVHEVAKGLLGTGKALAVIPCGSGDGLARHLGISHIPELALRTIKHGVRAELDCGKINGEPFFCTAGVGLDAIVSDKFARASRRGLPVYIEKALETWSHFTPESYYLEADGRVVETKAVLITVGNANQWGNEGRIAPLASLRDGLLDVCIIKPFFNIEIPILAAQLMDGRISQSPRVEYFKCRSLRLVRENGGPAHFDGDPVQMGREIQFGIEPGCLETIVPSRKLEKI